MNNENQSLRRDIPINSLPMVELLAGNDNFAISVWLLGKLESITPEERARALWASLPADVSDKEIAHLIELQHSNDFCVLATEFLRNRARPILNSMLAEIAINPTLAGYAKATQFSADHYLALDDFPQWRTLYEELNRQKRESEDEPLFRLAESSGSYTEFSRYLQHDGPQRFAGEASMAIERLKAEEEEAWNAIPVDIPEEGPDQIAICRDRRENLIQYQNNVEAHWQFDRAKQRLTSVITTDRESIESFQSGQISADRLFVRLGLAELPIKARASLRNADDVLWAVASKGTVGQCLDYLERSILLRHVDSCLDQIRDLCNFTCDSKKASLKLGKENTIEFLWCDPGSKECGSNFSMTSGFYDSIRRVVVSNTGFWFTPDFVSEYIGQELSGNFHQVDVEASWTFQFCEFLIRRINVVIDILQMAHCVDLPTENEFEFAIHSIGTAFNGRHSFTICKDHFAYYNKELQGTKVYTSDVNISRRSSSKESSSLRVIKGGGRFYARNGWKKLSVGTDWPYNVENDSYHQKDYSNKRTAFHVSRNEVFAFDEDDKNQHSKRAAKAEDRGKNERISFSSLESSGQFLKILYLYDSASEYDKSHQELSPVRLRLVIR